MKPGNPFWTKNKVKNIKVLINTDINSEKVDPRTYSNPLLKEYDSNSLKARDFYNF